MKIRGRDWRKICLCLLTGTVLILFGLLILDIRVNAETIKVGTVVGIYDSSSLNVRDNPGTSGTHIIGSLKNGQTGEILGESNVGGVLWYKIRAAGIEGWVSSVYISVTIQTITSDQDFDTYLTEQGFPDSYKPQLQALHRLYPNWRFEAQHTNLNWSDAINGESALGRNLVSTNSISSWKSVQNGAYNWETGEWVIFDSGGWVMASREMIEYSMDPRNFLDSTNIFQFVKQSYNAASLNSAQLAQKRADLTNMVSGTYLAGTCDGRSYVDVIMDVAAETRVCPLTLASMMIQEQGVNGQGSSISGTVPGYQGYYNYFNIGAYKTSTMSAVERGLWYASGIDSKYERPWNTRTKSIKGGALYYGINYVNVGQDTLYLKKFNVQGANIYTHQYMTNVQGAISEGSHVAKGYDENARKSALIFKIPVYKNMPATACIKPTGNDNPNYMLKSLSVSGQSLTPTFSMYETSYSVIVPNSVSSVTISAAAVAATTSISGTGNKNLSVGTNKITITSKAQNGSTRTYTINIVRQEAPKPVEPETPVNPPSIGSGSFHINSNNTITGITDFPISAANFAQKISVTNGSVKITTASGSQKSGNVGTGDQVRVYDTSGVLKYTYTVIIYGDTSGDGQINSLDLLRIQKHILGISTLNSAYGLAADTSKDGNTNSLDLLQVQKHILGIKSVKQ